MSFGLVSSPHVCAWSRVTDIDITSHGRTIKQVCGIAIMGEGQSVGMTRFSFDDEHNEEQYIAESIKRHQSLHPQEEPGPALDLNLLAAQLEQLASSTGLMDSLISHNDDLRIRLHTSCQNLSRRLESPLDTIHRLSYHALPFSLARIGTTTGLWKVLDEKYPQAVSLEELAWDLSMSGSLLLRLLRFAVVEGLVERVAEVFEGECEGSFRATRMSRTLAGEYWERGVKVM